MLPTTSITDFQPGLFISVGENRVPFFPVGIVGGGPGGTGPLIAALQQGKLPALLQNGVGLFEGGDKLIRGNLGNYQLNSDTLSNAFLEVFDNDPHGLLNDLRDEEATRKIEAYHGRSVPLPIVGDFLECMGSHLKRIANSYPASRIYLNSKIDSAQQLHDGTFLLSGTTRNGNQASPIRARCRQLIVATGGVQSFRTATTQPISGEPGLSGAFGKKVALTGEVLQTQNSGQARWQQLLADKRSPQVVIIGSSHSAFSTAWSLLQSDLGQRIGKGGIRILYRTRPKLYFGSGKEATAAGYTEFTGDDVCPVTGRLFRLAGLRFDGRELLMQVWRLAGRQPEERVSLEPLDGKTQNEIECVLDNADLIVPAFGYRPRGILFYDTSGDLIPLRADDGGALVDRQCRIIRATKSGPQPLANAYGIGLASGFVPSGKLGGEPSFQGQTNGFWLYQNGVGEIILNQLVALINKVEN